MKKRWAILGLFVVMMLLASQVKAENDITKLQNSIGTDKVAHFFMGATCSMGLTDRVFTKDNADNWFEKVFRSKKYRKAKAVLICTGIEYLKERSIDTAYDRTDFGYTGAGIMIGVIEF